MEPTVNITDPNILPIVKIILAFKKYQESQWEYFSLLNVHNAKDIHEALDKLLPKDE